MSQDEIAKIYEELSFLRKHVFFQMAQIQALVDYAVSLTQDVGGLERTNALAELQKMTAMKYEKIILDLGDQYPNVADDMDIRTSLSEEEKKKWFPDP